MKLLFLFLFAVVHTTTGADVIYRLSKADYYRLPMKNHLDRFAPCIGRPGGVYCTANADIVSDEPNELLDLIEGYSAAYNLHFNYSDIKYGLCITKRCAHLYNGEKRRAALWNTTEACLNETIHREHGLKVRVRKMDCYRDGQKYKINNVDIGILTILGSLFALNVIGTLYDCFRDQSSPGNKYLLAFSLRINWNRLWEPLDADSRRDNLQCLNGIRAFSSIVVIFGHIPILTINTINNPEAYEALYEPLVNYIAHNGTLVTSNFFTISGFLLAKSMIGRAEKGNMTWTDIFKNLFRRWKRLTPTNFIVMLITAIYFKFIPVGPLFGEFILRESNDCRKYWLYNMFYVNNLIDHSQCNLQVWFLASDFQLHILGVLVIALSPSRRVRNWALALLYLVAIAYPAYQIYSLNLDGKFISTMTATNYYFLSSATFNKIFKSTFPNTPSFVIGMCFGIFYNSLENRGLVNRRYTEYRRAFYLVYILLLMTLTAGVIFYLETPMPMFVKLMFNPIIKPLYAVLVNLMILGCALKCEDLFRGILEWEGWVPVLRISYCSFLVHMYVVRYLGGTKHTLSHMSTTHMTHEFFGVLMLSWIFACIVHISVELPLEEVITMISDRISPSTKKAPKEALNTASEEAKEVTDELKKD